MTLLFKTLFAVNNMDRITYRLYLIVFLLLLGLKLFLSLFEMIQQMLFWMVYLL